MKRKRNLGNLFGKSNIITVNIPCDSSRKPLN